MRSGIGPRGFSRDSGETHIHVDDIGLSSDTVTNYGTTVLIVNDLISRRYVAFTDQSLLTHISTNLKPETIEKRYGAAIESRINEMFTFIPMIGKDFRKK